MLFPLLEVGPVGLAVGLSLGTTSNGVVGGAKAAGGEEIQLLELMEIVQAEKVYLTVAKEKV